LNSKSGRSPVDLIDTGDPAEHLRQKRDKKNLKRLQDIEKLDDATKDKLYFVIDNIVQNFKAKKAYAS